MGWVSTVISLRDQDEKEKKHNERYHKAINDCHRTPEQIKQVEDDKKKELLATKKSAAKSIKEANGMVEKALNFCLPEGTLVLGSGTYYNIEEIKAGDVVVSYDLENGQLRNNRVIRTYKNLYTGPLANPGLEDGEHILATVEHPFHSPNNPKPWVSAGNLQRGDTLTTVDADNIVDSPWLIESTVASREISSVSEIWVYNIEVAEDSNYFAMTGSRGLLVHNCTHLAGTILDERTNADNIALDEGEIESNTAKATREWHERYEGVAIGVGPMIGKTPGTRGSVKSTKSIGPKQAKSHLTG